MRVSSLPAACLAVFLASSAGAATLLHNGDFERGELSPWHAEGASAYKIQIVPSRACFSDLDISHVRPRGRFSAQMEPSGVLRSDTLSAGEGFGFIALNVMRTSADTEDAGSLWVEIIDNHSGELLIRQQLSPASVQAGNPCGGDINTPDKPGPGFSSHYISTRDFSGTQINIRLRHDSEETHSLLFTLIDQLILFAPGEQTLFQSRPYAQAGFRLHPESGPLLTSRGSLDPDNYPRALRYSWYLEGKEYPAATPCLEDLPAGNHQATLYVNDGHHAVSDTLSFWVPESDRENTNRLSPACDPVEPKILNPLAVALEANSEANSPEAMPDSAALPHTATESSIKTFAPDTPGARTELPGTTPDKIEVERQTAPSSYQVEASKPARPNTAQTRQAYALKSSGISWQVENNGRVRIITPPHFPQQSVTLLNVDGIELDQAIMNGQSNRGISYTFSLPSSDYPVYGILRIGHTDYLVDILSLSYR